MVRGGRCAPTTRCIAKRDWLRSLTPADAPMTMRQHSVPRWVIWWRFPISTPASGGVREMRAFAMGGAAEDAGFEFEPAAQSVSGQVTVRFSLKSVSL